MSSAPLSVCVVGVGASGTLAAVHLLREARGANRPTRLVMIDRSGSFGPGIPYRTPDPSHLLNTAAGRMSALADDDEHFVRWSRERGHACGMGTFLPRGEYGRYLSETLLDEQRRAAGVVEVERIADSVIRIVPGETGVTVFRAAGNPLRVDAVVLAPGADPDDPLGHLVSAGSARYVADPWRLGALGGVADGSPVLVVGTGLSMMDIAISLTGAHSKTVVHAVSRHGLLPRAHRSGPGPPAEPAPVLPAQVHSVGGLLRFARRQLSWRTGEWRDFVDQLRPHTSRLWQQLDVPERRRFLDRVNRFWEVHRHRAAPATDRRVARLRASGVLRVHRGRVAALRPTDGGYLVDLDTGGGRVRLRVGWIVNATGARLDVTDRPDPLVRRLLADGLARPDSVRLGVATDGAGRLLSRSGRGQPVFTLGVLRRGELFETTAVPEIRGQAAAIAAMAVHGDRSDRRVRT